MARGGLAAVAFFAPAGGACRWPGACGATGGRGVVLGAALRPVAAQLRGLPRSTFSAGADRCVSRRFPLARHVGLHHHHEQGRLLTGPDRTQVRCPKRVRRAGHRSGFPNRSTWASLVAIAVIVTDFPTASTATVSHFTHRQPQAGRGCVMRSRRYSARFASRFLFLTSSSDCDRLSGLFILRASAPS